MFNFLRTSFLTTSTEMTDGAKPLLKSNGSQARFNMGTNMENQKRKKVLVVGAGATSHEPLQALDPSQSKSSQST